MSSIGTTYVGKSAKSLNAADEFDGISKVVIQVTDELEYTSGTDTGRTLTIVNPWGTQAMADNLLEEMQGYGYQPYEADGAILDPAAELGDGVTIKSTYSGLYRINTRFGHLYNADIAAPSDEEIDSEYPYISATDRKITRQNAQTTAALKVQADLISAEVAQRESDVESITSTLSVQADEISAKVNKTGGSSSSFSWTLTDSAWTLKSGSTTVLTANSSGLSVRGTITATAGTIGGFTINSNYISYNSMTWGGTNSIGIYIGTSGIQLGKNFKVDASGNLSAASGTFTGEVYAGNIKYGGSTYGTLSGSALTSSSVTGSQVAGYTLSNAKLSSGVNTSLNNGDYAYDILVNGVQTSELACTTMRAYSHIYYASHRLSLSTVTVRNSTNTGTTTLYCVTWV